MSGFERRNSPPWRRPNLADDDTDPLTGFANIMDVMLVFALGLLIALIAQSRELRGHFQLEKTVRVHEGRELIEPPDSIRKQLENGAEGMESLGQVYRDAETGKLILVGQ